MRTPLALLLVLLSAGAAFAQPSAERVAEMLSSYEAGPSQIAWRALGPETVGVLAQLYNDADQPTYVRLRAVSTAAHFPIPATRTFLRAVAASPGQTDLFVRHAVLGLARAFGAEALEDVRPYLTHRFPVVREAAIRACGEIGTDPAMALLRGRMSVERDPVVLDTLSRSLGAR